MIAKTLLMLLTLGLASVLTAYGVWFALKARQGWQDSASNDENGEPGWMVLGALGSGACLIALVWLACELADNTN